MDKRTQQKLIRIGYDQGWDAAREVTDDMVESVMLDLMKDQVAIIQTFRQTQRDSYLERLRDYVRAALARAFDPDQRVRDFEAASREGKP